MNQDISFTEGFTPLLNDIPVTIPGESKFSDKYEVISLELDVPFMLDDITLTLKSFHHKFQEKGDTSYMWIDVEFQSKNKKDMLTFHEFKNQSEDWDWNLVRTNEEFEGYQFQLWDHNYWYSISLEVRKIILNQDQ